MNRINRLLLSSVVCLLGVMSFEVYAVATDTTDVLSTQSTPGYRIDQPGTITFTVGVKISGKVDKPQVVIFLPKEKTLYRRESFDRSFKEELTQPLPFDPGEGP